MTNLSWLGVCAVLTVCLAGSLFANGREFVKGYTIGVVETTALFRGTMQ